MAGTAPIDNNVSIIDCSHGLVCLHVLIRYADTRLITVWNPSIRKDVSILLPSIPFIVSFGVCPQTSDPKIVNITFDHSKPTVEVLTLSTRAWRSVPMNLSGPSLGSKFSFKQVVIDGVIYRVAYDSNPGSHHVIMSFDLTNEEFGEVALPDRLGGLTYVNISKLKESLGVIDYHDDDALHLVYEIWIMSKNGVSVSSIAKLFSVKVDTSCSYTIFGFRMNGQAIMTKCANGGLEQELVVYDPNTKIMNGLGIYGYISRMVNYTESLLMINYSDRFHYY
ncbi:uncharacterized protein LOC143549075 [Bidens hawaiensis]|uniref:uncharacterized protein LOC143549075 n=1 Tax=Bidens hawaiensis TaxID=980011 RepID=UPI004049A425